MLYYERDGTRSPLARVYGQTIALGLDYSNEAHDNQGRVQWTPLGSNWSRGFYAPQVQATDTEFAVYTADSMFRVYLLDEHHIHCRMLGAEWDEGALHRIYEMVRTLPYSAKVVSAIIDRADWLDANPGYRGLAVKQSKSRRVAPATLEV